jgi:hypothetical protein
MGGITAISKNPKKDHYTVGTNQCNIYNVTPDLISADLLSSCHYGGRYDAWRLMLSYDHSLFNSLRALY